MNPNNACINELVEGQAKRTPDRIAAVYAGHSLTYDALNAEANQLAHFLRECSVRPDTPVGIYMERSIDALIGLLGVIKAGGAYVPLDLTLPQKRLEYQLADINTSVLLTHQRHRKSFASFNARIVCLDRDRNLFKKYPVSNPRQVSTPENIAYVIYTSGSTGSPKGVIISHSNLVNYTNFVCDRLALYDTEVLNFALVSTLGTDLGNTCLFPALVSGGCLHVLRPETVKDSVAFASYISGHEIDVLKITPSHLTALLVGQKALDVLPRKVLILGGETLSFELYERLRKSSPYCRIINHYGPTETTVGVLCTEVERGDWWQGEPSSVPIGKPISNTSAHILDSDLKPVPNGKTGELYIGGNCVGRGYLNRPGLTAQQFICDPFSQTLGKRLYKTGDLCRYLPDGSIEFINRVDRQIKIRGFRIEIEEIEVALRKHPLVYDVAITVSGIAERRRLVACVILTKGTSSDAKKVARILKRHLRDSLEPFKIPSDFIFLDQFPLTESGKLDYKRLPLTSNYSKSKDSKAVGQQSWAEVIITDAWKKYLNLAHINNTDNFYDLGGDSIIAIQISGELYQQGIHLPPQQLFEHHTIAKQVEIYKIGQVKAAHAEIKPTANMVPLTPIQQWFFEQGYTEVHHWNQAVLLEVEEKLDPDLLKAAVEHLIKLHDCFGLSFIKTEAGWQQFSDRFHSNTPLRFKSLKHYPASIQEAMIEDIASHAQASLRISEPPLLRVVLFDLGGNRPNRLLIIIHHLIVDGISWRILIEGLQQIYHGLSQNFPVEPFKGTTSFKEWASQLTTYAQSPSLEIELRYWRMIKGRKFRQIPRDENGENSEGSARTIWAGLNKEETMFLIKGIPSKIHASPYEVLLAALTRVISAWTDSADILIDVEGHGREELIPDLNLTQTVGWFTSLFPLALESRPGDSFRETLSRVQAALQDLPNRGSGYGLLRYLYQDSAVRDELAAMGQAEICFNYLGQFNQVSGVGFHWKPAPEFPGATRSALSGRIYALKVSARIVSDRLYLDWSFSQNIHAQSTICRLAKDYLNELRAFIGEVSDRNLPVDGNENRELLYSKLPFSGLPITIPPIESEENGFFLEEISMPKPSSIILTGATGFLGSYLLRELLYETDAQVYCLVRGENRDAALKRILGQFQWYFPTDGYKSEISRIHVVVGDIRSPQLGLYWDEYQKLASTVDTIFHAAADVRLIGNPQELFETNIAGTRHVIAFAARGKIKRINHVSTLSVVGNCRRLAKTTFSENDLDIGQHFNNPYEQSKFEAEKLVKGAMASGASAVIYRFNNLAADSVTGRFQPNIEQNRIYLNLKSFIQMGVAPYLPDVHMSFSYVDIVAKGIVALSLLPISEGQVYHVENSNKISYYDLLCALRSFGYSIVLLDPDEYIRKISTFGRDHEHLYARNSIWGHQEFNDEIIGVEFDNSQTEILLKRLKVEFPQYSIRWLREMFQHCINVNFFSDPSY